MAPAFQVGQELVAPVSLLRSTSDEYFARLEAEGTPPFGGLPIDFAYIDGMHLLEYALRDFIGVEQYSARSSVVAFDDVLPRNVEEAARDRHVMPWTGDVFRIPLVLTEHRPDLVVLSIDTKPAGTLLVTGLDSENRLLAGNL